MYFVISKINVIGLRKYTQYGTNLFFTYNLYFFITEINVYILSK